MKPYQIFVREDCYAEIYDNDTDECLLTLESEDGAVEYMDVERELSGMYEIVYEGA